MNKTTVGVKAALNENQHMLVEQAPLVKLLNGLTDERLQWQTAYGRQDYLDSFGDLIPKGRTHYRQGDSQIYECLRLSARSMASLLQVMFSNYHGLNLAKKVLAEREASMRQAWKTMEQRLAQPRRTT